MIQRKLSKAQGYAVQVLAVQLTQLQAQIVETQEALNEQAELLRARYGLPEGESRFGQGPDGWELVVTPAAKPKPETEPETEAEEETPEPPPTVEAA